MRVHFPNTIARTHYRFYTYMYYMKQNMLACWLLAAEAATGGYVDGGCTHCNNLHSRAQGTPSETRAHMTNILYIHTHTCTLAACLLCCRWCWWCGLMLILKTTRDRALAALLERCSCVGLRRRATEPMIANSAVHGYECEDVSTYVCMYCV